MRRTALLLVMALATPAAAQDYVLQLRYEESTADASGAGSGSASGQQAIAERELADTPDGVTVEYSLPGDAADVLGNESWMFPARILIAPDGRKSVLNADELAARNAAWLARAQWPPEVCERWLFTWTAIQIRCDPAAAIDAVETFGMRPGRLAEGQSIPLPGALGAVLLTRTGERNGHLLLTGTGPVDPAFVRAEAARTAMVVAEVSGTDLTQEQADAEAAAITASGTLSVTFEVDQAGLVWRREDHSEVLVTDGQQQTEQRRASQTVTRMSRAQWEEAQVEQD